jgi:glycosyltransferase involved in cell wall biosynthesis
MGMTPVQPPQRIGAFFQHMPPYSGAAALRGASVMQALARQLATTHPGVEVRVYTTTPSATPLPGLQVHTLPVAEVENALGLVARLKGELRMGLVAARHLLLRDGGCALVIVSTPGYVAALVATTAARWRRVPYVLELRDVYPQVYAEAGLMPKGGFFYRAFAALSRRMYEGARHVIAATEGLAREVREAAPRAHVSCVYNGFPAELLQRQAPKHQRFTVCFHGVLGFFQDVDTLVAVARELASDGIDVVAIGYGRREQALAQAGLANLRFLGRLGFAQTMAEVERCHVGLCLRLDDGISKDAFPVKVWEYLGLGIPSIVTPPCEAGEFLQAHGCGMQLRAGDVAAISAAVRRLQGDPALLAQWSAACRHTGAAYTREATGAAAAQVVHAVWQSVGSA